MKRFIFQYFPHITLALLIALLVLLIFTPLADNLPLVGSIAAAIAGFCYFVQEQKLQELRLFKELFTDFNSRYDRLNAALRRLTHDASSNGNRAVLLDYFNLCAEEYLWHREGYILPEVWQAWCRGMLDYFTLPAVRELWEHEVQTGSYYGLTTEEIKRGAESA